MKDMMKAFAKYAKEQFGYNISFKKSSTPDTFESLFGESFIEKNDNDIFPHENMLYKNIVIDVNNDVNNIDIISIDEISPQLNITLAA
ncbi:MAG: hypothetical protein ACTTHM_00250 [Peptoanaerobacter stomatis]|uniref:Uncharacterized protein n=1 Tax=Peptoanaerobacter stomatis TaxID=796937 RepID=G9XB46_9FIRM|nr:hypothetical protein [Peptoanaerobacter stomatis]EHL19880.1 hypothetical protein HMPREF9628_01213 [Peptoanaerobacter stomatis]